MTKSADELASEYQKEILDMNPCGFTVAPYVNSETLAAAFLAGHASRDPEVAELKVKIEELEHWIRCYTRES